VWVLADDRAGNVAQALGVAEALAWPYQRLDIAYTPLARLPNGLRGASLMGISPTRRATLVPPWPDVLIAAGRRTAPVARWVRAQNHGKTFTVQIMHPGGSLEGLDLVAVPHHDGPLPSDPRLLRITGAPHRVTPLMLEQARAQWAERLSPLPAPRIALLVGGATKDKPFTEAMARELGQKVEKLVRPAGGSVMLTTSRRTGAEPENALLSALEGLPAVIHRWGAAGDNPYPGFLAWAEAVVVTGDSMSMCSEACGTGKPVYIFAPDGTVSAKHARLHAELYALGCAQPLGDALTEWTPTPLNAAQVIARAVKERIGITS
ncbi:MAG: nucleoside-diphosphate sugar epimerase, partial [Alphaproteobacteria bacterium RIFOXYD12_FULL_60_8]